MNRIPSAAAFLTFLFFALAMTLAAGLTWADGAEESGEVKECFDVAETQRDLNRCAGLDYQIADKELNDTYQAVLKKHADDETFLARLRDAQRTWIAFRDAEMKALYPHIEEGGFGGYGSVFPMCWSLKLASLTRQRTEQLRQWLVGVPEGEVCAGSLPLSERPASEEP